MYNDYPYSRIFLSILEFINFLYSKFSSAFVISDTFYTQSSLKSIISLFVVVIEYVYFSIHHFNRKNGKRKEEIGF